MAIIVTHNDMDGFCSGELIKRVIKKEVKEYAVDYTFDHNELFKHEKDNNLYITDYSFKPEKLEQLTEYFNAVIWIDHHTCINDPLYEKFKNLEGIRRIGDCGAKLTLEYLYKAIGIQDLSELGSDIDNVISIVDAYDCWKTNSELYEYGCLLNTYFYSIEPSLDKLIREMNDGFKNSRLLNQASTIKKAKMCESKAYEIPLINTQGLHSWLVMEGVKGSLNFVAKYDKNKHSGMLAYNYLPKAKLWEVSLYSDHEEINCAEICRTYGGGGHKSAAGFQATTEKMIELGIF